MDSRDLLTNLVKLPIVPAKSGRMFRPRPFYIYYFDSGSKGQVCLLFKVRVANFIILVNVTPCRIISSFQKYII
jgi:hypothetical protein